MEDPFTVFIADAVGSVGYGWQRVEMFVLGEEDDVYFGQYNSPPVSRKRLKEVLPEDVDLRFHADFAINGERVWDAYMCRKNGA